MPINESGKRLVRIKLGTGNYHRKCIILLLRFTEFHRRILCGLRAESANECA